MIVTTGDLKEEYEIVGPVYSTSDSLAAGLHTRRHKQEIAEMKKRRLTGEPHTDWALLYGEFSLRERSLAFFVAVQELKKQAEMLGADAVIGMRQAIDRFEWLGAGHFSLYTYGTAVRLK